MRNCPDWLPNHQTPSHPKITNKTITMSHCRSSCQLREELRNKESKVNRLPWWFGILPPAPSQGSCDEEISRERNDSNHPDRNETVNCPHSTWVQKMQLRKVENPENVVPKSNPRKQSQNGTVSRLTTSRPHPKGTVSIDRGRTRAPEAQHPQTPRWSPQTQHIHFQANLLICWFIRHSSVI